MRLIVYSYVALIALATTGCTYRVDVTPDLSPATESISSIRTETSVSIYIAPRLENLNQRALRQSPIQGCGGFSYYINAGPAITAAALHVNEQAFVTVVQGGTPTSPAGDAEYHFVFDLQSFRPFVSYEVFFVAAGANANVELVLSAEVIDRDGNRIMNAVLSGYATANQSSVIDCGAGGRVLSAATTEAIERVFADYIRRVIQSDHFSELWASGDELVN